MLCNSKKKKRVVDDVETTAETQLVGSEFDDDLFEELKRNKPYLSRSQKEQCTMELVPAAVPIHSEISTREKQRECRRSFPRASHRQ